ncbi:pirin family protein [Burkholderia aenigmatica]|uniref:Pirin family protein n=1 Tax=Burkholderia aenigmatica TaxID=2015348 RepID=A0ABY6XMD9_9BURK|nr:pirin family protein [Burkholderia aenigmatica]VWC71384.1 pirin family protein [Burkholderia aenigmatica]
MTAGDGIIHEEYHSPAFAKAGGLLRSVQLWVNLPAKDKMRPAGYQGITATEIPNVELPGGAGRARVIAGELFGTKGPARTFTPINVWDVWLNREADATLTLPKGHTAMLFVVSGDVTVNGADNASEAEMLLLSRDGDAFPMFSEHSAGMAQFAVWTALAEAGIGASLQHYNPLIDAEVAKQWNVPASWRLRAQMPFGSNLQPFPEKTFIADELRFKTFR